VPLEGRDMHGVLAQELLRARPETRLLILSLVEPIRRSHPGFRNIGDVGPILRSPILLNYYWLENVAFLPYRNLSLFVQSIWPQAFGVRKAFDPERYAGTDFDTTKTFVLENGKVVDREAYGNIKAMEREARLTGWNDNVIEQHVTSDLAQQLVRRCAGLVLVHLPVFRGSLADVDLDRNRQWAPVLLTPPTIGDRQQDFSDGGHLRRAGIDKVSRWLPSALRPYLGPLRASWACAKSQRMLDQ
jgi:hypothetical protein